MDSKRRSSLRFWMEVNGAISSVKLNKFCSTEGLTFNKVIMGNGGFYDCLSEPLGISAWWKETAQTRIRSFSFLVAESP